MTRASDIFALLRFSLAWLMIGGARVLTAAAAVVAPELRGRP
ncbi:hypothetical protein [Jiella pelagia]|uniref:Uncharacterized protein n=1 Tax=Jiella pelagia TaxID=2986949 RepID=A0ABY7BZP8_9HYPH|nr:hypothetical protein [Jiella pelagia]WAP69299.1 hypothetical protein OH818_03090 [Jiella pelagia]